ncbi:MAG TPA: citrate transporter [Polyangia bacterium]|jgi:Na+/H+ antiporter NhaD/arsenite permease-like protein|nr:citrate transporter [Polyangia bacterium]
MDAVSNSGPTLLGTPVAFLLFGLILVGILLLQRRSLEVSLVGLLLIVTFRLGLSRFDLGQHLDHEWVKLANLFGLLVGFTLMADHFEGSRVTARLPRLLPSGRVGCFSLLVCVWILSGLLDNIAAALIGATAAMALFKRQVHLGYLAAIVAAANAGGAGSVLGDTTTTMLWIDGVSPLSVLPAYIGTTSALVVFGAFASAQQHRHAPIDSNTAENIRIDSVRLGIVLGALALMIGTNLVVNNMVRSSRDHFPFLATALWVALVVGGLARPLNWRLLPGAIRSSVFLLALVLSASLMPVEALPRPSWLSTLAMGFVSAVFDNIPLTKLALDQGGYDWALLAYAVGFGGSMVWFGSSAGVAITGLFPEAKSVVRWLRAAWHVPVGFLVGFFALYLLRGWNP